MTLVVIMTGEGWYDIMNGLSRTNSDTFDCIERPTYQDFVDNGYKTVGCGSSASAKIFFGSYIFMVSMILINLFVAVTLQGFNDI